MYFLLNRNLNIINKTAFCVLIMQKKLYNNNNNNYNVINPIDLLEVERLRSEQFA